MRNVVLACLFGCTSDLPPTPTSATPTPPTEDPSSFFGAQISADVPTTLGDAMVTMQLPDGETALLVASNGQGEGSGSFVRIHRIVHTGTEWETPVIVWSNQAPTEDLGVLTSLHHGHDIPTFFAAGSAWDLRDGTAVDYEPVGSYSPIPCGDVDGDGLPDRCHDRDVLLSTGGRATLPQHVTSFYAGPRAALGISGCLLQDVQARTYERVDLNCDQFPGLTRSARNRDVDGDGTDDIVTGVGIQSLSGEWLAEVRARGGGLADVADLDGDGVLDMAHVRLADDDHDTSYIVFYRGPLEGELTPDGHWNNPCHRDDSPLNSFGLSLEFLDVDRDGILDVVASDPYCDGGRVFVNTNPFG